MSDAKRPDVTYQAFLDVPDTMVAEIVQGDLYASPRPAGAHTLAASSLLGQLVPRLMLGRRRRSGWWIVGEPELHLDEDVLVPDLAGWRRERLPEYPRGPFVEIAPDWICEVLSRRTARLDLEQKLPLYGLAGCTSAWLIDPEAMRLDVFRFSGGNWSLVSRHWGNEEVRAEPFEDFPLALETLWYPGESSAGPRSPPGGP